MARHRNELNTLLEVVSNVDLQPSKIGAADVGGNDAGCNHLTGHSVAPSNTSRAHVCAELDKSLSRKFDQIQSQSLLEANAFSGTCHF
jgi:hypothetical protein